MSPIAQTGDSRIDRELVRLVVGSWTQYVDGIPFALLLAVLNSGILAAIGHTPFLHAVPWIALQVLWSLAALALWRSYQQDAASRSPRQWTLLLSGLWFLHGVVWALVIPVFWDAHNPVNQALICTNILGVMVGSFYSLSPSRVVFVLNIVGMVLASLVGYAFAGGALAGTLSVIFPFFAALIVSYGWQLSAKYRQAIEISLRNQDLVHALSEAKCAAEEASRAKSLFLANMSHELRTPLNAIIGFSEIIRDRVLGEKALDKYSGYAADVVASGTHLLSLINGVLDLAKIEAGKMTFEAKEFGISRLIAECARITDIKAREKGLELIVEDQCGDAKVRADETALRQILLNLLSNAVKFTDTGSVRLRAHALGNHLRIDVIDSGCGIGEREIGRIFAPFERADNSFSAAQGGTGLGLAMVKRLVELHGGICCVESEPGRGTHFAIDLPIVASAEPAIAAA